jgi:hypothetical protein
MDYCLQVQTIWWALDSEESSGRLRIGTSIIDRPGVPSEPGRVGPPMISMSIFGLNFGIRHSARDSAPESQSP